MDHIATMDPPTTLALCRALRVAVEGMGEVNKAIAGRAVHFAGNAKTILGRSIKRITSELEKI